MMQALYHNPDN